jgi:hypothetical protein
LFFSLVHVCLFQKIGRIERKPPSARNSGPTRADTQI